MDELDLVAMLRDEPQPDPVTRDRHRGELRAAIATSQPLPTIRVPRRNWRRRWVVVSGVAAAAVIVILVTASILTSSDSGPRVAVPSHEQPPVATQPISGVCGAQLPLALHIPDGFTGPTVGPHQPTATTPNSDQFVQHWTSATGSIELRWPPDPDSGAPLPGTDNPPTRVTVIATAVRGPPDSTGSYLTQVFVAVGGNDHADCTVAQIDIRDSDPQQRDLTFDKFLEANTPAQPLITATRPIDALPPAITCRAPEGTPAPPNIGGPVNEATAPTPEEALRAFVQETPGLVKTGYQRLDLPDGTIAYAAPFPTGDGFVTVIHVEPDQQGWTVDSWDSSAC